MSITCTDTPIKNTGKFPKLLLDYISDFERFKELATTAPHAKEIAASAEQRNFDPAKRQVLQKVLQQQYSSLEVSSEVQSNIDLIGHEHTYTVTTGHQLNLLTGPLYTIFKAAATINLAKEVQSHLPEGQHCIPIFWLASEDHDFAEIASVRIFGKTYTWETDQTGACGAFSTQDLSPVLDNIPDLPAWVKECYTQSDNLAQATQKLLNHLFGRYGLLVLDPADAELKKLAAPLFQKEIEQDFIHPAIEAQTEKLKSLGYAPQIETRPLNLFLLDKGYRGRLQWQEDGTAKAAQDYGTFTKEELLHLVANEPEKLSPNVASRPLYQEYILPNLAYVGGPAELAYWLQLGQAFQQAGIPLPSLVPRAFGQIVPSQVAKKIHRLGFKLEQLFQAEQDLKAEYLAMHEDGIPDYEPAIHKLEEAYDLLKKLAKEADPSLEAWVAAEHAKALKSLENATKRITKAVETKHAQGWNQLLGLKDKILPDGTLQERKENIFCFSINHPEMLEQVVNKLRSDFHFKTLIMD